MGGCGAIGDPVNNYISVVLSNLQQARNHWCKAPLEKFSPPWKNVLDIVLTIGHSSKNLGPSEKTLRPSWCPKLVTGLICNLTTESRVTKKFKTILSNLNLVKQISINCKIQIHQNTTMRQVYIQVHLWSFLCIWKTEKYISCSKVGTHGNEWEWRREGRNFLRRWALFFTLFGGIS